MLTLNKLRTVSDFLIASGEIASIEVVVRGKEGTALPADKLITLKTGLADQVLPTVVAHLKDVQTGIVEPDVAKSTMVVRLYAYGRMTLAAKGRTAGGQFEVKMLALVRSLIEEIEKLGLSLLEQRVLVTAKWCLGAGVELGDTDPVVSTDVAAIDRRVQRIEGRRQRLKKYSAAAILSAAIIMLADGYSVVSFGFAEFSLLIPVYAGLFLAYGVWARAEANSLFKDIEAIRGQQDLDAMLKGAELERRAMKLFQVHSQQLKRYYDQALRQRGFIFFTGIFCIIAGFSVIVMAFVLLKSANPGNSLEKILVAALGAIGGILGNFIAVVYLRMFSETVKSIGTFHDRLVATHHLHFANFLVSKVADTAGRDTAFRLVAEIAATQEAKAQNGTAPKVEA
ncbi:hypothetical protein M8542_47210 [Amycolatopsis sp. OK19-0408]|uniref:Cyanobacterial TRADD-N associated 2 transmembrane domain-containing protein n=1 Tax=Amycolatopsis iheyensis TaxID=2945988 RepID=A0A9X2SRP7_9PSEU|nr:hypothetical protein [Amycolatopsis iheyensis]MCR6490420.1 hypothetical protein [Amycolatopsis iheyensis]